MAGALAGVRTGAINLHRHLLMEAGMLQYRIDVITTNTISFLIANKPPNRQIMISHKKTPTFDYKTSPCSARFCKHQFEP